MVAVLITFVICVTLYNLADLYFENERRKK